MKSVDPTIKIVGPDLSWQYQPPNDWLTPILTGCGDLFDVVSIHRYPYSAAQVTLAGAASDAVPGSPARVPAALWLADILGSALNAGLWTTSVWDISDPDDYSLGLVSLTHVPRPEYYAYGLYAAHFGPTLLKVTTAPTGVSAYASRNPADTATEVIAINWGDRTAGPHVSSHRPVHDASGRDLRAAHADRRRRGHPRQGSGLAWIYGDAQLKDSVGPQPLAAEGTAGSGASDAGENDGR